MLIKFANDRSMFSILLCIQIPLLLYSTAYGLYQTYILQFKQITECDLCTLTIDKSPNERYRLYVISSFYVSLMHEQFPTIGVYRMAHNRQGFPLRSNERPAPPTTPPVALDCCSPCYTRLVWGTAQKKMAGYAHFLRDSSCKASPLHEFCVHSIFVARN